MQITASPRRTGLLGLVLLALVAWLVCPSLAAYGQLTTAEEKGLPPNATFDGSTIDQVNLTNGNLHISIPILSVKQRGGTTLSWNFIYDTQSWLRHWIPNTDCTTKVCDPPGNYIGEPNANVTSGWRLTSPFNWLVTNIHNTTSTCVSEPSDFYSQWTNWEITDPQGTIHALPLHLENLVTSGGTNATCVGQTVEGPALDGSGMYFNSQTGILSLKDGTQLPFKSLGTGNFDYGGPGSTLTDANGNEMGPNDTLNRPLITTTTGPTVEYTSPLC
jgi:hypothetical protein